MHPWQDFSEADRAEYWATLALKYTSGIGPRTVVRLLKYFGSAFAALENKNFWQDAQVSSDKARALSTEAWRAHATTEWRSAQKTQGRILLWKDICYPESLRSLIDAPSILYYRGDISLVSSPCFAIVGARKCSAEGVRVASEMARHLSKAGISIVSGMAQGIDRVAHVAALSQVGKSIGVLGTGIDIVYPPNNADVYEALCEDGLVLSEFAPYTEPLASHFPIRNRIVSGLCLGVLVVEGMRNSGSLITARLALEQNREVFAVPGAATAVISQGCQELVRQGAKAVFTGDDILCDLAPLLQMHTQSLQKTKKCVLAHEELSLVNGAEKKDSAQNQKFSPEFSEEEREDAHSILRLLHAEGQCHPDAFCVQLNKPISYVNALLIEMELLFLVKKEQGGRYTALSAGLED